MFHRSKTSTVPVPTLVVLALVVVFVSLAQSRPVMSLTGLGTTAILAALLIEVNAPTIWEGYRSRYRKSRYKNKVSEPKRIYYSLNVAVIWPVIAVLGVVCLVVAAHLSTLLSV